MPGKKLNEKFAKFVFAENKLIPKIIKVFLLSDFLKKLNQVFSPKKKLFKGFRKL